MFFHKRQICIKHVNFCQPPPPKFLSGTLYFKFLDGVGYGWGEDKINPSQQLVAKPYPVLAKVHASYISSLIIYT